ncbi:MAG: hypothetical protein H7843_14145 [Nitrospirota bacterium]
MLDNLTLGQDYKSCQEIIRYIGLTQAPNGHSLLELVLVTIWSGAIVFLLNTWLSRRKEIWGAKTYLYHYANSLHRAILEQEICIADDSLKLLVNLYPRFYKKRELSDDFYALWGWHQTIRCSGDEQTQDKAATRKKIYVKVEGMVDKYNRMLQPFHRKIMQKVCWWRKVT